MDDRQLIEDLLSALEYHTEQTRPIEFSKVAIEAAREYLRKPAQQEPMVIYVVKYQTGYDYAEFVSYHQNKDDAEKQAKKINKENPGIDAYVEDLHAHAAVAMELVSDLQGLTKHLHQSANRVKEPGK